jgi:glycosyltransferase involved in cell wall biosynthesis
MLQERALRPLRPEREIMRNWPSAAEPLVSIRCTTYNHARYIEDALEGFLIQETDFPFEIIIHDDASTDGTAAIVRDYAAAYPCIIRPVLQTENQYSQGKRISGLLATLCRGKYVAVCEGDDFWTDPHKLAIQVGFLERNPDYVITGHDAYIIDDEGRRLSDSKLTDRHRRDFSGEELILGHGWVLTMSWVFRNVIREFPPERNMVLNGDNFMLSLLGHYGKSKYMPEIKPACYRVHAGGIWSQLDERQRLDSVLNTRFWIYRYYLRIGETRYAEAYWEKFSKGVAKRTATPLLLRELLRRMTLSRQVRTGLKALSTRIGLTR